MTSIDSVRNFWEENPLWVGETEFEEGTLEFFLEHRDVYYKDCFAGSFDMRFLPPPRQAGQLMKILDLGCGIGFWTTEFGMRGYSNLHAADLTKKALEITAIRLKLFNLKAELSEQNAEKTNFDDQTFDHVNCQGVIHHTPNTEATLKEIARILKPGGTASISVYYRNIFLRSWKFLRPLGWLISLLGAKLKGRGRENIFKQGNVDEIVRLYDGLENPIGKSYSRKSFTKMLSPCFDIEETYLHFFPARSLPFKIPQFIHEFLDKRLGFMIYATLRKKCVE
jgi:2-polyprenyl-3-methyl-5-hydroxy-6-metoxy-1,4-benzoquinol methylase